MLSRRTVVSFKDSTLKATTFVETARGWAQLLLRKAVALYTDPTITPEELWRRLSETDLPKLWLPKLENIHHVDELPLLGTGKLDLQGVRARALELSNAVSEAREN